MKLMKKVWIVTVFLFLFLIRLDLKLNQGLYQKSFSTSPRHQENSSTSPTHQENSSTAPTHQENSSTSPTHQMYFQPNMNPEEKAYMLDTVKALISTLEAANLTYVAYGGTLIGTYRHHGFIPWDDDTDIMLNFSQKAQYKAVLKKLEPQYTIYFRSEEDEWKFYPRKFLAGDDGLGWKWPFIDVFFFKENETHIWDSTPRYIDDYIFKKSSVFPLVARPFEDIWIQSPCNPEDVLSNYNIDQCSISGYSHKHEEAISDVVPDDVPCAELNNSVPLVQRTFTEYGNRIEVLNLAGKTLQKFVVPGCTNQVSND